MGHISGGAASGIGFGVALFILVSISLVMWWRRVHRDHYSKDPNTWGGSWGVKAMQEAQARMDAENDARYAKHLQSLEHQDIEMAYMESKKYMANGNVHVNVQHGVPTEVVNGVTRPQRAV